MITEVVAALIWENDKFMMCQRPAHKARGLLWEFVGGKVEPGEIHNNDFCPADEEILKKITEVYRND